MEQRLYTVVVSFTCPRCGHRSARAVEARTDDPSAEFGTKALLAQRVPEAVLCKQCAQPAPPETPTYIDIRPAAPKP